MTKSSLVQRLSQAIAIPAMLLLGSAAAQAAPVYWTDWTGGDQDPSQAFLGQGTITTPSSTVTVTYSNPQGVGFYQPTGGIDYWTPRNATSPYTSTLVDNPPTGTDIVALQYAGTQTLTFSQSIANPVFAYVSLNGNGYAFLNQDFDILSFGAGVNAAAPGDNSCGYWGCGTSYKQVVHLASGDTLYELLGTGEPHGVIRFTGAFDTLTWTSLSNEYWNGFTVGVQGTAVEVFNAPAPGALALFGLGLFALGALRRKATA